MRRIPKFWGLHAEPPSWLQRVLALTPFILLIAAYFMASEIRLRENPQDKILPSFKQMAQAVNRLAFQPDKRAGEYVMLKDTVSSLRRLLIGVGAAALVGLVFGVKMGLFPGMSSLLLSFITFASIVPPLALLPVLFITFGVDELAKVMLIFVGTFPLIARDIFIATRSIPREQITKSLTLGANSASLIHRIILPQIMPRLIDTVRLCLGSAWLFLIAAEAIASEDGLGYRIFLVRRYLAMDVIIPYVLWITFLGFIFDLLLQFWLKRRYHWYLVKG